MPRPLPAFPLLLLITHLASGFSIAAPPQGKPAPAAAPVAQTPSPKKGQDFVIERVMHSFRFENDGSMRQEIFLRVRIATDAGVEGFGKLATNYDPTMGTAAYDYVQVTKPDGQVRRAGEEAFRDVAIQPYPNVMSDLHQLQVVVPALTPGAVLEYRMKASITRPQVPGQFWFNHRFMRDAVVEDELLTVDLPAGRPVQMTIAPGFEPTIPGGEEDAGRRVYRWKRSNPVVKEDRVRDLRAQEGRADPPEVQLTTFPDWDSVAAWYLRESADRAIPDETVRAKAIELTRGRTTKTEKLVALYDFVSSQCRYFALAFGAGRMIPHPAKEVLANRYGDCKDRHTLLAALASAVGIATYPALIASTSVPDPKLPSPAQADHMITVVPLGTSESEWLWLDSSVGVAPFGWIGPHLRDKTAIVLIAPGGTGTPPRPGTARLVTTPPLPPVSGPSGVTITARLTDLGTLDTQVRLRLSGDDQVPARAGFRMMGLDGRPELVKAIAKELELTGTPTDIQVSGIDSSSDPVELSFHIRRENWFDRSETKPLALPLYKFTLLWTDEEDWRDLPEVRLSSSPVSSSNTVTIDLPAGFVPKLPLPVSVVRDYGEYRSTYAFAGNRLTATRSLNLKPTRLPASRMRDYLAFLAAIRADEGQRIPLDITAAPPPAPSAEASTSELYSAGLAEYKRKNYTGAIDLWKRVVEIEPKHRNAWDAIGLAYTELKRWPEAVQALHEQVTHEPYHDQAWGDLAWALEHANKRDEAIAAYRKAIEIKPLDAPSHRRFGMLLARDKAMAAEAVIVLRKAEQLSPKEFEVVQALAESLLATGDRQEALAALERAYPLRDHAGDLSELAVMMVKADLDVERGERWAREALAQGASDSMEINLAKAEVDDADDCWSVSWSWYALGLAALKDRRLEDAERYLTSVRSVRRSVPEIALALAEVAEKRGRAEEALSYTAEAAFWKRDDTTRLKLEKLTGSAAAADKAMEAALPRLLDLHAVVLAGRSPGAGSRDFLALFTNGSARPEIRTLNGDAALAPLVESLKEAVYRVRFPDKTPARILTAGRLACREKGADCMAVLTFGTPLPTPAPVASQPSGARPKGQLPPPQK